MEDNQVTARLAWDKVAFNPVVKESDLEPLAENFTQISFTCHRQQTHLYTQIIVHTYILYHICAHYKNIHQKKKIKGSERRKEREEKNALGRIMKQYS